MAARSPEVVCLFCQGTRPDEPVRLLVLPGNPGVTDGHQSCAEDFLAAEMERSYGLGDEQPED